MRVNQFKILFFLIRGSFRDFLDIENNFWGIEKSNVKKNVGLSLFESVIDFLIKNTEIPGGKKNWKNLGKPWKHPCEQHEQSHDTSRGMIDKSKELQRRI